MTKLTGEELKAKAMEITLSAEQVEKIERDRMFRSREYSKDLMAKPEEQNMKDEKERYYISREIFGTINLIAVLIFIAYVMYGCYQMGK